MKQILESLSMDKIYALIESKGELESYAKRHKLARSHVNISEIKAGYARIKQLMHELSNNKALKSFLDDVFCHNPSLAISHIKQTESLQMHEFFELKSFLWNYMRLWEKLSAADLHLLHPMPDMSHLFKALDPEANKLPVFRISPQYSPKLAKLLELRQSLSNKLKEKRAADLQAAKHTLSMPSLKDEFVMPRSRHEAVTRILSSKLFVVKSENLANYTFCLADTADALAIKQELNSLQLEITDEETKVLYELSKLVHSCLPQLETAWHSTVELCWDYMLSCFALKYGCCIPKILDWTKDSFPGISLVSAVNLPLKLYLEVNHRSYQALDICLSNTANLITGPNMGGKSTALITLGQICHLASIGIPVPAKQAELPIYDSVYYNHDKGENSENLSSFGREVIAFNAALQRKGRCLMLLDEFAKGTNPAEGEAICMAVFRYLSSSHHSLFAATHFSAPARLPGISHFSIKGISEADFQKLQNTPDTDTRHRLKLLSEAMDYSLIALKGKGSPPQCAVKIASILGLPQEILDQLSIKG